MNWRDLLYFSKGERQALILLLLLIVVALLILIISDKRKSTPIINSQYIINPENIPDKINSDSILPKTTTSEDKQPVPNSSSFSKNTNPAKKVIPQSYTKTEKYPLGTIIELNTADTTILKKVPGIGSTFARRIIKYRDLLGGFYTVSQLQEIYGMDSERYQMLQPWFHTNISYIKKISVNHSSYDALVRHPYLDNKQAKAIYQLRQQKGKISGWENLQLLDEFSTTEVNQLDAYLSFDD